MSYESYSHLWQAMNSWNRLIQKFTVQECHGLSWGHTVYITSWYVGSCLPIIYKDHQPPSSFGGGKKPPRSEASTEIHGRRVWSLPVSTPRRRSTQEFLFSTWTRGKPIPAAGFGFMGNVWGARRYVWKKKVSKRDNKNLRSCHLMQGWLEYSVFNSSNVWQDAVDTFLKCVFCYNIFCPKLTSVGDMAQAWSC